MSDKLEKPVSLRFSRKVKRAMEDLAEDHGRSFNKEVERACARYIHNAKFNMKEYTSSNDD